MDFGAVRDGLAHQLEAFNELTAVYPYIPDRVVAPCAIVVPGDPAVEFHTTMAGVAGQMHLLRFDIVVVAARFDAAAGQTVLDRLISTLPAHLEADQTLSGSSEVVTVTDASNYGIATIADTTYVAARLAVEVHTR